MKTLLLLSLFILPQQATKNDPNGIWRTESGSEFQLELVGNNIEAHIIPGSSPSFIEYSMDLRGTEEPNTYEGTGQFKARLKNGKECQFETQWHIIIVATDTIIGVASGITPDPETCEKIEVSEVGIQMQRKQ